MIEYFSHPRFGAFSLEHPDGPETDRGVMLVHGFTGSPADMRPLATALFEAGYDCHVPMHPGMATDIANLNSMTAAIWRETSLERWREHTERYAKTVLIGYSMGGSAAIQMAAEQAPDLLLLIAPFTRINDRRARFLPIAKHMIREVRLLPDMDYSDPDVRQWFKAALPDLDIDDPEIARRIREETGIAAPVIDELRKFGALGLEAAGSVNCPVVVLQGHQDTVVHPRYTRQLIDRFSHLNAYHEVPGDHLLPLDTLPTWPVVRDLVLSEVAMERKPVRVPTSGMSIGRAANVRR